MSQDINVQVKRNGVQIYPRIAMQLDTLSQMEAAQWGGAAPYFRFNGYILGNYSILQQDLLIDLVNTDPTTNKNKQYRVLNNPVDDSFVDFHQELVLGVLLSEEVQTEMNQGGDIILQEAQSNAYSYFANPSGALSGSITRSESPYEIIITSDAPHAHRRNDGFVGADSLGRVYNDPPYYFMSDALSHNQQQVLQMIETGVSNALAKLAGGL